MTKDRWPTEETHGHPLFALKSSAMDVQDIYDQSVLSISIDGRLFFEALSPFNTLKNQAKIAANYNKNKTKMQVKAY